MRVRYPDAQRFDPARLSATTIRGKDGQLTPASALVTIEDNAGDPELMRENLRQMALITARLEDRDLGSAVDEIRTMLAAMPLPVGYTWEVGGQYESQRRSFRELLLVSGIATALVLSRAGRAVPRLHRVADHPGGGAALVRRRVRAAAGSPAPT